jgi:hypothetical protein
MKNFKILLAVLATTILVGCISIGCTENQRSRTFGGSMTINLPPNQKLVNVTWKETQMWYLIRPMRTNEFPESYKFIEKSSFGMLEGTATFLESR